MVKTTGKKSLDSINSLYEMKLLKQSQLACSGLRRDLLASVGTKRITFCKKARCQSQTFLHKHCVFAHMCVSVQKRKRMHVDVQ